MLYFRLCIRSCLFRGLELISYANLPTSFCFFYLRRWMQKTVSFCLFFHFSGDRSGCSCGWLLWASLFLPLWPQSSHLQILMSMRLKFTQSNIFVISSKLYPWGNFLSFFVFLLVFSYLYYWCFFWKFICILKFKRKREYKNVYG